MATVLVLGATGYIGSRLIPRLLDDRHTVRCLVRNPDKIRPELRSQVTVYRGDVLHVETMHMAFKHVDVVIHLIHSMGAGETRFIDLDKTAASHVVTLAAQHNVKQIIYLGGLGRRGTSSSSHLRSRHETGDILRSKGVPVTELRAAVVVGSGSVSFEMVHHLVNRLPVMICPRWVTTRTQPISVDDVLAYLCQSICRSSVYGEIIDIGGPDVLTYREMMLTVARVLGLRRMLIQVPVLTPRLSSYWVNLVTPIPSSLARALIEGLREETICEDRRALERYDIRPMTFEQAVRTALERIWAYSPHPSSSAAPYPEQESGLDPSHLLNYICKVDVQVDATELFAVVASIGGENGWYYANWLWRVRGGIDRVLGGVGLRRGRPRPDEMKIGDPLDFWRVERYVPNRQLLLRAEMKVWGQAWLEFAVDQQQPGKSRLTQTARYYPRGLIGLAYWYAVYPLHTIVFNGMIRAIRRIAESRKPD
ncbi:MAG: SDR family oxidoreductase [candidate division Zixibacteria bacterium]|nr:SDR family oxidoreductase [candidate division Zixibacteria bacterium]